jgi:hypothetical protein
VIVERKWYHIACVKHGTNVGIYVDGVQVAYDTQVGTDTLVADLVIGNNVSGVNWFDGYMEQIQITHSNKFGVVPSEATLLSQFDGSDGDQSNYTAETGQTVTTFGTAQLDTAEKMFGTASMLLDGNSDYLTVPDSSDWTFGTGDFTIDFWVRWNGSLANTCFYSQYEDGSNRLYFIYVNSVNSVRWFGHHQ